MNNDKLKAAIAEKAKMLKAQKEAEAMALLENDNFLTVQARIMALSEEVTKLDGMIHQLNTAITPFVAKDGSKYTVRVFPVNQFGIGLDKLIGIVAGSASAFTEEMAMQYEAIVGVPFIELQLTNAVLGTVDYVNKDGIYVEGSRTLTKKELPGEGIEHLKAVKAWERSNAEELHGMLQALCLKLDLYEILPTVEKLMDMLSAWERTAQLRANKQKEAIDKAATLNESSEFTIED